MRDFQLSNADNLSKFPRMREILKSHHGVDDTSEVRDEILYILIILLHILSAPGLSLSLRR